MISKKTKYGLKALGYLAKTPPGEPISTAEIAKNENISPKFLESILAELKKQGIIASKKGKGGGCYLMKPSKEISIASVIRILEGPIAWLPCVSLNYYEKCTDCASEESCSVHSMFEKVRDNILEIVENQTLADL
ncbi:RrF2 family transcriptional regulator [Luteibaculum oceani]|uniref:Rrf2 family transcriptional regulator n=1 Tax=Luteibaculum oceani TaxID=1294296 RepID=A0A5C6V9W9_9FLAO|nr:Rrf2 family transcriptional regulator [Luteibaculum oceani]TXC81949.1 Rrf2 family transcriptional regulator [Luteibaculum oceani]